MYNWIAVSVVTTLIFTAGCTAGKGENGDSADVEGAASSSPTWHQDVRPLIESSCSNCHQEGAVGGFPLETYEDVSLIKAQVADAVADRRMPPWKAVDGCADYRDDISSTQDEIDVVVEWVDAGAPLGDPEQTRLGEPPRTEGLERVDLSLPLPVAYEVNTDLTDDYRCFAVDWPLDEDVYVTGYEVKPDRADLVHHMIAYIVPGSYADALAELEAEDGRPGYECFGGPGPISQADAAWLGAWAPGAVQGALPNNIGLQMEAGSMLVLQMHYNSKSGATGTDQTKIDFMVESTVDRPGWIQPFTNPSWVFGGGMTIPANSEDVRHSFETQVPRDLEFHTANIHMHTRGRTGRMEIQRADGTDDCMIQIDDWDFDWQRSYVFEEPKSINSGDVWHLDCSWDNATDSDLDWGEGTGDEMCLGTALVTLQ